MPKHLVTGYKAKWNRKGDKGEIQIQLLNGAYGAVENINDVNEFIAVMLILGKSQVLYDDQTGDFEIPGGQPARNALTGDPTVPTAIWNDTVLAESDDTKVVDGNHYFPADSIQCAYFKDSSAHTVCGWKGRASYYDIVVGDEVNEQAAWYYPEPKPAAAEMKNDIAFWKGVQVVD